MGRAVLQRLALLLLLAASLIAGASSRSGLTDTKLAARIDGDPIPLAGLRALHAASAYRDMRTPLNKVLASVIDNRLLGDYARKHYDEATLFPNTGVAYSREVAEEDQLIATLRRSYKQPLDAALAKAGGLDKLVTRRDAPSRDALELVFPPATGLQLTAELAPSQLAAARDIALLRYRFPGGDTGQISLADVWQRQNIQGKTMLAGGDASFMAQQAMQLLAGRYVLSWARHDSGLTESDLQLLRQAMADRDRRGALLQVLGVEADMHYASANIQRLAAAVTADEIRDYYQQNPSEFRQLKQARAQHIRCADEAACRNAYARLQAGEPFAEVARSTSTAEDAAQGGELGWLQPQDGHAPWLYELAFALPLGKPSRPVREPDTSGATAGWQIVLVNERQEGLQPLDSEAVRYTASQTLARRKAVAEFKALREQLYREADIELNASVLGVHSVDKLE
ncbi:peptidylprolyl isomerase [Chitinimonas sp.]|uniref:peptidylprolyl isomerase n=1 Tax=Chitinimonas sp. TaxID=1934313 RepID=UPI002F936C07